MISGSDIYLSVDLYTLYPSKSLMFPTKGSLVFVSAISSQVRITLLSPAVAVRVGILGG